MGYKIVVGKIKHIRTGLGDVRLGIDVAGSSLKRVFKGEVDWHELHDKKVRVYIPKIKDKHKGEEKRKSMFEKIKLKKSA